jgi:hypothetical protein
MRVDSPRSIWQFQGRSRCNRCQSIGALCGVRTTCQLYPLYNQHAGLLDREGPFPGSALKALDYKFLFLLALSLHPEDQVKDEMAAFPFRVDLAKQAIWLGIIRGVEQQHPGLEACPADGPDPFLVWILTEKQNPGGLFHATLNNCLIPYPP